jgi:uncharacterized membrane protein
MGRSQADVTATAIAAGLACVAAAAGAPTAAMTALGFALFLAPGYVLGQLLVGSRVTGLERAAVITGLALVVPVLGGLLLYVAGVPLHRPGWLGLLAGVTLAGDVALFLRRRAGRAVPFSSQLTRQLPRGQVAVFAAAVLVAACAVGLARIGVATQPRPGFTQMWLLPQRDNARALSLGVSNDEGRTTRYLLVLLRHGWVSATWNLTLTAGQTWQRSVPLRAAAVEARLYRLPDLTHPYRYVFTGSGSGTGS